MVCAVMRCLIVDKMRSTKERISHKRGEPDDNSLCDYLLLSVAGHRKEAQRFDDLAEAREIAAYFRAHDLAKKSVRVVRVLE